MSAKKLKGRAADSCERLVVDVMGIFPHGNSCWWCICYSPCYPPPAAAEHQLIMNMYKWVKSECRRAASSKLLFWDAIESITSTITYSLPQFHTNSLFFHPNKQVDFDDGILFNGNMRTNHIYSTVPTNLHHPHIYLFTRIVTRNGRLCLLWNSKLEQVNFRSDALINPKLQHWQLFYNENHSTFCL